MELIAILVILYLVIGVTFMGIFPDSNCEPNIFMMILWPISIVAFVIITLLFIPYNVGRKIRSRLICYKKRRNRKYDGK